MAIALTAAVAAWMLTGLGGSASSSLKSTAGDGARPLDLERNVPAEPAPQAGSAAGQPAKPGMRVTVLHSKAEPVVREVVVSARTEPNRKVEIKAETQGRVVKLGAERGAAIEAGARLASLDVRDREAKLREAETLIEQRKLQYEAVNRLKGDQLVSEAQIAEAKAQLVSAEAALESIRLDLARTKIVAPFAGALEERLVELGDYVGIGDPIARIVDNDPLIAVGSVSERAIGELEVGDKGRAQLVNGKVIEGEVRYIAPLADESTHTFRVELAIPNDGGTLPAGMTAQLQLPAAEVPAHFLSASLLTLDDAGDVGVKTVGEGNLVRFYRIDIVRSAKDGVWVTGLPQEANVIAVGQGFVTDGMTVQPVFAEAPSAP
jgi:multidrug efflux system membrane fusion protein